MLSPITKKLEEAKETTQKLGEVFKESSSENVIVPVGTNSDNPEDDSIQANIRALPNSNELSFNMMEIFRALKNSKNSLKLLQDDSSRASTLGTPINTLGGDKIRINDNIFDLTPKICKTLTSTAYSGKPVNVDNDILMMNSILRDLGYTGVGDRDSKQKHFFTKERPKMVEDFQNKTFDEIDLEGQGVKTIIPSNLIDIYTRLEIPLGLKLSGHTQTFTEASNLIDEIYKRGEIQNKQEYQIALIKFQILKKAPTK